MFLNKDIGFNRLPSPVFIVGLCHDCCSVFHLLRSIAHRDTDACFFEHREVVEVVPHGEEICLAQAPVGSAVAAQFMDWLIGYGVKKIILAGSCGVLVDIAEKLF